ncbi:unnamed protein product [Auanema sp. JU1783]|nr:unnamed protein product [Auanema sp. JU1783]
MSEKSSKQNIQHLHLILKNYGFSYSFADQPELLEECRRFMLKIFHMCQFNVKTPLDEPIFVNDCFVNECAIPFEITGYSGDNMSASFFDIAKAVKNNTELMEAYQCVSKINIRFASDRWFSKVLRSAHQNVSTKSLFFATIVQYNFFEHWSVKSKEHVILTDFEYDRERIFTNFYQTETMKVQNIQPRSGQRRNRPVGTVNYQITIPFKHVRKILVDEYIHESSFLIHFVLSSPPFVNVTKPNGLATSRYRTVFIFKPHDERRVHFKSSPKALTESPVFTVDIKSSRVSTHQ